MSFRKVELKPLNTILYWFVWKSNVNLPLEGYFLGIVERTNPRGDKDKAMVVFDDNTNKAFVAFLKGSLHSAPWQELLLKKIRVTYWEKQNKRGFELEVDDEDELPEMPHLEFKDKFEGFKFILKKEEEVPF
jgi:hypothetical protein